MGSALGFAPTVCNFRPNGTGPKSSSTRMQSTNSGGGGGGNLRGNIPKHLSHSQGRLIMNQGYRPDRSILTSNPQTLLDGFHSGQYRIIRWVRGRPLVDFGSPIGLHFPMRAGQRGQFYSTRYGYIHHGKRGAHIIPASPKQY